MLLLIQVLLSTLVSHSKAHFLFNGYQDFRYNFPEGPLPPSPLPIPPHHLHHPSPLHAPLLLHRSPPPPQPVVLYPPLRGVFPPFIERIVQRIQTFWSVYNPPELLTRPPLDTPTTNNPKKKVTTTTPPTPTMTTTTTVAETDLTTTEESGTKVSTLVVFEVTPTVGPVGAVGAAGLVGPEAETEEPLFITPERASVLARGQREEFLRLLKSGELPPYLQLGRYTDMDLDMDMDSDMDVDLQEKGTMK